jgi:arabinofuranan 3-O-arabinosyltransferase
VLSVAPGSRRSCVVAGDGWACSPSWSRAGEEVAGLDRTFTTHGSVTWGTEVRVVPIAGPELDSLLDRADGFEASGSSAYVDDAAARPGAAVDGDPSSSWIPSTTDVAPRLDVTYPGVVTASGIRVTDGSTANDEFSGVVIAAGGRTVVVPLVHGMASFAPVTSKGWRLTFRRAPTVDGHLAVPRVQVVLEGTTPSGTGRLELPCSAGLAITVDGAPRPLAVSSSVSDVLRLSSLPATPCDDHATVTLAAGQHRLGAVGSSPFSVTAVSLTRVAAPPIAAQPVPVSVATWAPEARTFTIPAGPETVVALGEGFNAGWTASVGGVTVTPIRLDGWRQAWRVPSATTVRTVDARYAPAMTQRVALAVGALLLLVVVAAALVPGVSTVGPVGAARRRRGEVTALTLMVPALVASWAGLVVGAAVLVGWRRTSAQARAVFASGTLALAGLVAAAFSAPWGTSAAAAVVQLLAVLAVALVSVSGVDDPSTVATRDAHEDGVLHEEPRREGDGDAAHESQ